MPPSIPGSVAACLVSLIVGVFPNADELEVQLKGKGVRAGYPDPSTNDAMLRLRVGEPDGYVTYGIDWKQISQIRYKTVVWTPDRFAALREELTQKHHDLGVEGRGDRATFHDGPDRYSVRPLWQAPERPGPSETLSPRVQFIEIDAVAANWDRDPQWDGLVVRVWPMDQDGKVIRAAGTLTVSLAGETSYSSPYASERIGHWVRAVHSADYGSDGASFRLEFQNYDPERWDAGRHPGSWIAPFGTVNASMAIPGHGVFEASNVTPVRLRRFNPERDRLLLRRGAHTGFYEP